MHVSASDTIMTNEYVKQKYSILIGQLYSPFGKSFS